MQTMHGGREQEQECRGAEVQANQASQPLSSTGHHQKKRSELTHFPQKISHPWMPHWTNVWQRLHFVQPVLHVRLTPAAAQSLCSAYVDAVPTACSAISTSTMLIWWK